jgi:hypothetical protein
MKGIQLINDPTSHPRGAESGMACHIEREEESIKVQNFKRSIIRSFSNRR